MTDLTRTFRIIFDQRPDGTWPVIVQADSWQGALDLAKTEAAEEQGRHRSDLRIKGMVVRCDHPLSNGKPCKKWNGVSRCTKHANLHPGERL